MRGVDVLVHASGASMPHKRIRWSWISIVPLAITLARPTRSALQAHEEKRRAAIAMESLRKFIPGPGIDCGA